MAHPTQHWLLEPTIPAPPALPRLDRELYALAGMGDPSDEFAAPMSDDYPSGTYRLGLHPEHESDGDPERFATSDPEAPTVRPGSLHALKTG